ncbi:MAG TPA: hypothetical protein VFQ42_22395 [Mycobacterium sp.]|nr:hypothetical protein [Mycobacterium sp.]
MHSENVEHDWDATCKLVTELCRDLHTCDGTSDLYQRIYDVRASIHASGAHLGQVAIAKEAELQSAAAAWVARGDAIRARAAAR